MIPLGDSVPTRRVAWVNLTLIALNVGLQAAFSQRGARHGTDAEEPCPGAEPLAGGGHEEPDR